MRGLWLTIVFGGLATVAACSGGSDDPPPPPAGVAAQPSRGGSAGTSGRGGSSGSGGSSTDAGEGGEAGEPPAVGGPNVTILSPAALARPDDGEVLTGGEVEVVCEVTESDDPGASPVLPSSVTIEMTDEDGASVDMPVSSGPGPDEYSARFVISDAPNGRVTFVCTADDTATPRRTGTDTVRTFIDHGPSVTIVAPARDSAHGLFGAIRFEFQVSADPLASDDPGAELEVVTLTVADVEIPDVTEDGGTYTVDLALDDTTLFPVTPIDTVPVQIRATNSREPEGVTREVNYSFLLDSVGPVVTITSPEDEQVLGGEVSVRFTVTDARSEVNPSTVSVRLNNQSPVSFTAGPPWTGSSGDSYVFTFDTTEFGTASVSALINVSARDLADNPSNGESVLIFLDNVAPTVDLDPLPVRERRAASPSDFCSVAFDPAGAFAANDYERVLDQQVFRALALDRANVAPGMQTPPHYSHVDPSSVYLYFQTDSNAALLVDEDGDTFCDDVASQTQVFESLNPINPTGSAFYGDLSAEDPQLDGKPPLVSCVYDTATQPPNQLCSPPVSDLTRVVPANYAGTRPALFATGQFAGSTCTGVDLPMDGIVNNEGWFCVAVRATDNAGNVGISPPLRLCYDDSQGTSPTCLESEAPSCTDGCTPPSRGGGYIYLRQ